MFSTFLRAACSLALIACAMPAAAQTPPDCSSLPAVQLGTSLVQTYANYPMAVGLSNATRLSFTAPASALYLFELCTPSVPGMRIGAWDVCSTNSNCFGGSCSVGAAVACASGDSIVYPARAGETIVVYVGGAVGSASLNISSLGDPLCGNSALAVGTQRATSSQSDPAASARWYVSQGNLTSTTARHQTWHQLTATESGVYRVTATRGRLASRPTECGTASHLQARREWNTFTNSEGAQTTLTLLAGEQADISHWEESPNTFGPYQITVEFLGGCTGDIDIDGTVGASDLSSLLAFWGPSSATTVAADLNADGYINGADLALLLSLWGPCPQ
jgi:hypothetical protein